MTINLFKKFKNFDSVTEFRLINSFLIAISVALMYPLITTIKGVYMATFLISAFGLLSTLSVKANNYLVERFTLQDMYRLGVIFHLTLTLATLLYFINPSIMIIVDSLLVIAETAIFSSYSIMLTNHLVKNNPNMIKDFQIVKNSNFADGSIIGAVVISIVTFTCPFEYGIALFVIYNVFFNIWMLKNWNFKF